MEELAHDDYSALGATLDEFATLGQDASGQKAAGNEEETDPKLARLDPSEDPTRRTTLPIVCRDSSCAGTEALRTELRHVAALTHRSILSAVIDGSSAC